jgi:GNAT superfamily N-acetyltransferase
VPGYGSIRAARADELERVQTIENEAGELFAQLGMVGADDVPPVSLARLEAARRDGRLVVVTDAEDLAIGFALVETVDGEPHLKELDVLPDHGRRGLGRRLVAHVVGRARAAGAPGLSLTTYRDVPWNGPFYLRLGFRELADEALGPELSAVRRREREAGLDDAGPRIAMRLELAAAEGG